MIYIIKNNIQTALTGILILSTFYHQHNLLRKNNDYKKFLIMKNPNTKHRGTGQIFVIQNSVQRYKASRLV